MACLDGILDISEFLGRLIVHDLGDYRCHRRFAAGCLLSSFRCKSLIYMSLSQGLWVRLSSRLCEFPIPDVLDLGLERL
jgi:hypothetical protein